MKITKQQLKQIIKEELSALSEGNFEEAHNDEVIKTIVEKLHKMNSEQIMQSLKAINQIYTSPTDFGAMQEGRQEKPRDPYADESPNDAGH